MGLLTPILVRNDELNQLTDNEERTVLDIYSMACNPHRMRSTGLVSVGYSHADHDRVLIVSGNTMIDVGRIDEKCSAESIKSRIKILSSEVRRMKRALKEAQAGS